MSQLDLKLYKIYFSIKVCQGFSVVSVSIFTAYVTNESRWLLEYLVHLIIYTLMKEDACMYNNQKIIRPNIGPKCFE